MKVIILAGGIGKRLWPLSSKETPKQFLKDASGHSAFQKTLLRNRQFGSPYIITSEPFFGLANRQLLELGFDAEFILEQSPRGTAFALLIGLLHASGNLAEHVLVVPADHQIKQQAEYLNDIKQMRELAAKYNQVSLLGIKPCVNPTAYGCFTVSNLNEKKHLGKKSLDKKHLAVDSFIEKPNKQQLASMAKNNFYVNSGIYCLPVAQTIQLYAEIMPDFTGEASRLYAETMRATGPVKQPLYIRNKSHFLAGDDVSFDKAIIQEAPNLLALPASFDWQDLGNWQHLLTKKQDIKRKEHSSDGQNNAIYGQVKTHNVENSIIHTEGYNTCVIGVQNLVIVAKGNNILVTHKNEADKIKELI